MAFLTTLLTCAATLIVGLMAYNIAKQQKVLQQQALNNNVSLTLLRHRLECIGKLDVLTQEAKSLNCLEASDALKTNGIAAKMNTLLKEVLLLFDGHILEKDGTEYLFSLNNLLLTKIKYRIFMDNCSVEYAADHLIDDDYKALMANIMQVSINLNPEETKDLLQEIADNFVNIQQEIFNAYFNGSLLFEDFRNVSHGDRILLLCKNQENIFNKTNEILNISEMESAKLGILSNKLSALLMQETKKTIDKIDHMTVAKHFN